MNFEKLIYGKLKKFQHIFEKLHLLQFSAPASWWVNAQKEEKVVVLVLAVVILLTVVAIMKNHYHTHQLTMQLGHFSLIFLVNPVNVPPVPPAATIMSRWPVRGRKGRRVDECWMRR